MLSDELLRTIYLFRGIERLAIQVGAIGCIAAGTLLYRWGVQGNSNFSGEGAGFKFQLGNAAPGTVLALFGMIIMGVGLANPAHFDEKPSGEVALDASAPPKTGAAQPTTAPSGPAQSAPNPSVTPPSPGTSLSYAGTTSDVGRLVQRLSEEGGTADPEKELAAVSSRAKDLLQGLPTPPQRVLLEHAASSTAPHGPDEAKAALQILIGEARALH